MMSDKVGGLVRVRHVTMMSANGGGGLVRVRHVTMMSATGGGGGLLG